MKTNPEPPRNIRLAVRLIAAALLRENSHKELAIKHEARLYTARPERNQKI